MQFLSSGEKLWHNLGSKYPPAFNPRSTKWLFVFYVQKFKYTQCPNMISLLQKKRVKIVCIVMCKKYHVSLIAWRKILLYVLKYYSKIFIITQTMLDKHKVATQNFINQMTITIKCQFILKFYHIYQIWMVKTFMWELSNFIVIIS